MGPGSEVVTEAYVECQPWCYFPIILSKRGQHPEPLIDLVEYRFLGSADISEQKIGDRVASELTGEVSAASLGRHIDEHIAKWSVEVHAGFEAVLAHNVVDGVSPLELISELPLGQEIGRSDMSGSAWRCDATSGAYVDSGQASTDDVVVGNTFDAK